MATHRHSIKLVFAIAAMVFFGASCAHIPKDVSGPTQIYNAATNDLKKQRFEEAKYKFKQLYQKFPSSEFADDALYRLGYISCLQEKYADARNYFGILIERYPKSEWTIDAGVWKKLLDSWSSANEELKRVKKRLDSTAQANVTPDTTKPSDEIERLQKELDRLREDNRKLREIIESTE